MVQANIKPREIVEEEARIPEEVLRLESLLLDNGWKMLVERFEEEIKKWNDTVNRPRPLGLSNDEVVTYSNDMELIKLKTEAYKEMLELPHAMMKEYGQTDFRVQYTKDI